MKLLHNLGVFFLFLARVLYKPQHVKLLRQNTVQSLYTLGIESIPIVFVVSVFMGGIITIQTANGFSNPFVPLYAVGFAARESIILEFSPTIICLILAGKVGSNIASEIGTMRITDQIDALDVLGVNSRQFLILPKITASILVFPFLVAFSMVTALCGGYVIGILSESVSGYEFIYGAQAFFKPWVLYYSFTKVVVFAFIISAVSGYFGYHTKGGALDVGKSSTQSVVYANVLILLLDLIITKLFFG
jgi:phospholipid/cholesterol/gamma-HCH transport system permease protein